MSILENYQLQAVENVGNPYYPGDSDQYAAALYSEIYGVKAGEATPMLIVRVMMRLRNGKSVGETIASQIAEEQFTNLRVLVGHYLAKYPMLYLLADEGRYLSGCVVKTSDVTHVEIIGERVEINDEDIRRGKFTAGGAESGTTGRMRAHPRKEDVTTVPFPNVS